MKRFILFAGETYYPQGGMKDLQGSFDTLQEALDKALELANYKEWKPEVGLPIDWYHVLDSHSWIIVYKGKVTGRTSSRRELTSEELFFEELS